MTNQKNLTAAAPALTLTGYRKEGRKTFAQFSDGSEAIVSFQDQSGFGSWEWRQQFKQTTHSPINGREMALCNATDAQFQAFQESLDAELDEQVKEEQAELKAAWDQLMVKVDALRQDIMLPRIKALEQLKAIMADCFPWKFQEVAATI